MPSSAKNYTELYKLQDKVLAALSGHFGVFHLTGGTALGRFYLDHRYSEDLDFFANQDPAFIQSAVHLRSILKTQFNTSDDKIVLYPDYIRIWVPGKEDLKIEMVNDVSERWGSPILAGTTPVDTIGNILANKLTALLSRDEPKDIFDIVTIASAFSFNWGDVFVYALRKAIIAEADVLMRLTTFPVEWLPGQGWLKNPVNLVTFKEKLDRIADDFLLAKDNSLGAGKTPIENAKPTA
ncbi:MAG: nucleotidyl transferase AbiEii/AbiGii toxin family protein [Bacteroidales bacterium]|jgi:hypothetical protein|nr:nucleotidyl transferase AbiEii/AbiGii toxin family protein [Bacteroidales bacterium]